MLNPKKYELMSIVRSSGGGGYYYCGVCVRQFRFTGYFGIGNRVAVAAAAAAMLGITRLVTGEDWTLDGLERSASKSSTFVVAAADVVVFLFPFL